jgi:hypothetical protein
MLLLLKKDLLLKDLADERGNVNQTPGFARDTRPFWTKKGFFLGICFSAAPARVLGFASLIPFNHREEA